MQLIGKEAEIVESKNKTMLNIKGKIINETKNTITIAVGEREKTAIKSQITLKINDKLIKPGAKRPDEIK